LESALRGQEVDPKDDRPITAEAECLERLGRFREAIEARTRAIAVATQETKRCESYHYRWRLHYWVGNLEAALHDINAHANCIPEKLFYTRVYPVFVYAEMGDTDRALEEVRAMAGASPDDIVTMLWSAACLRFLGHSDEADQLLAHDAGELHVVTPLVAPQTDEWLVGLFECSGGRRDPEEMLEMADATSEPRKLRAEVYFHVAMKSLAEGRRPEAVEGLEQAYRAFDGELRYTYHAKVLLGKLQVEPDWPPWLAKGRPPHPLKD